MLQALCLLLQLSTIFRVVSLYHPEYSTNPNLFYPLQVRGGRPSRAACIKGVFGCCLHCPARLFVRAGA